MRRSRCPSHPPSLPCRILTAVALAATPACEALGSSTEIDLDALPRLTAVEELRLGSSNDPDRGFSQILTQFGLTAADVDDEGNLYVFESTDLQVRVYDSSGREVRRFGGPGQGPGEFRSRVSIGLAGDTLVAIDTGARRISYLTLDGQVIGTALYEEALVPSVGRQAYIVTPRSISSNGTFITGAYGIRNLPAGTTSSVQATDTLLMPRLRYALGGTITDTAGWEPRYPPPPRPWEPIQVQGTTYRRPLAPTDEPLVVPTPDGFIQVERAMATAEAPSTVRLMRLRFPDDTVYTRSLVYQPLVFSDATLEIAAEFASRLPARVTETGSVTVPVNAGAPGSPEVIRGIRETIRFPPFQPPVSLSYLGKDGVLWLRREDRGQPGFEWALFDAAGEPLGRIELPRSFTPIWSRDGSAWGVELDELEVPWLVRYRLAAAE